MLRWLQGWCVRSSGGVEFKSFHRGKPENAQRFTEFLFFSVNLCFNTKSRKEIFAYGKLPQNDVLLGPPCIPFTPLCLMLYQSVLQLSRSDMRLSQLALRVQPLCLTLTWLGLLLLLPPIRQGQLPVQFQPLIILLIQLFLPLSPLPLPLPPLPLPLSPLPIPLVPLPLPLFVNP